MPHLLLRVTLWWVVIKSSVSVRIHNLHAVTALQNRGSGRWGRVKVEGQTCRNWFLWSLSLLGLSLWIVNLQETRCLRLCFYGCQFVVPHNPCSATSFCTFMTLDCRPWKSHAARPARELRPVGRDWKTEHKQIIDGLSARKLTVCTIYCMISYGVEPLDESPEVTRLGVIFRVARMVFTVSQNDCAANGPKVSYAVPCGRKIYRKPESPFANYARRE